MSDEKKLIRSKLHNRMVVFNVLKNDEIIITVKEIQIEREEKLENNVKTSEDKEKLNNEVYKKLEKIYKISLNDRDFQIRGLRYIENKLQI